MVNDSLIIGTMQDEGINTLITNDDGFSAVEGIVIYRPYNVKDLLKEDQKQNGDRLLFS